MRYITGLNAEGKSALLAADEPRRTWTWSASSAKAPHFVSRALNPEFGSQKPPHESASTNELWTVRQDLNAVTGEDPENYAYEPGELSLDVPAGVLRWCITRFGPGYASKIHHTDSIDLDMCIEGELTLVLETEEIQLRPGDAVVLPMLEHAWRTETGGAIAYCMISPHALGVAGATR
jgi:quercetin dioxygenase-like cupin family protein